MLVDQIGDVTITNDGATILKKLEVEHPAARVLVELAQHQDEEVGDGTTSVVILAAELLKVRVHHSSRTPQLSNMSSYSLSSSLLVLFHLLISTFQ